MPYTPNDLKQAIETGIPGATASIEDTKGTGDHFSGVIVSPAFAGKSKVEQHRMVHGAMKEIFEGDLHAFHFTTYTPESAKEAGIGA